MKVSVRDRRLEVMQGDSVKLPCSFYTMGPMSRINIIWTLVPLSDPESPSQVWNQTRQPSSCTVFNMGENLIQVYLK